MNLMNFIALTGNGNGNDNWALGNFLENATNTLKSWGDYFIILIGVIMIVVAAYQIGSGLMSHGKKQTNWFVAGALLLLGGAFMVGGFGWVSDIAKSGKTTIDELGSGSTILPFLSFLK